MKVFTRDFTVAMGFALLVPLSGWSVEIWDVSSQFNEQVGRYDDKYARSAKNLLDKDLLTVWEVNNLKNSPKQTYAWVTLDLGKVSDIEHVRIGSFPASKDAYFSALRPRKVTVAVSADETLKPLEKDPQAVSFEELIRGFTVAIKEADVEPTADWTELKLSKKYRARYVRFIFPPQPQGNQSLIVSELGVGGVPRSSDPLAEQSVVVPPVDKEEKSEQVSSPASRQELETAQDLAQAMEKANKSGKRIAVLVYSDRSENSREVRSELEQAEALRSLRDKFVWVFVESDSTQGQQLIKTYQIFRIPAAIVAKPNGEVVKVTLLRKGRDLEQLLEP